MEKFNKIRTGDSDYFVSQIDQNEVAKFAKFSGDYNPIHMDDQYAKKCGFTGCVVHGALLFSLVSRLIGMNLPGKGALILKESLEFKEPVFVGDTVKVEGTVVYKSLALNLLEIAVKICREERILVLGSVYVKILNNE